MSDDNSTRDSDHTSLLDRNDRILQAEEAGRGDDLAPLLHENFTIVRANGVRQNRQEFLDAVPNNAGRGRNAEMPEVPVYGECAVVVGKVSISRNPDGTDGPTRRFWNTRVFVRQHREWLCVAWQVTEIPAS